MPNHKEFIKNHPKRAVLGGIVILLLLLGLCVLIILIIKNQSQTLGSSNNNPISTPVKQNPANPPPASIAPTPASAPVRLANCVKGEKTYANSFYSFCYSELVSLFPGQQIGQEGVPVLTLFNPREALAEQLLLDRSNENTSLSFLKSSDGNSTEVNSLETVVSYVWNLYKQKAVEISTYSSASVNGIPAYTFTFRDSSIYTFNYIGVDSYPQFERKVLIFRKNGSDYIIIFDNNSSNQRTIESLVFF